MINKTDNKKRERIPVIILAAVLSMIIFAGTMTASALSMKRSAQKDNIGTKAAINVALSDAGVSSGEATFTKSKLDRDDNVYEVEFKVGTTSYDYKIDAKTSVIVEKEKDNQPIITDITTAVPVAPAPADTTVPRTEDTYIGLEAAKAAALKDAGLTITEVTFTKAILDTDNLIDEYELEFYTKTTEYDYDINAKTGAIIDKSVEAIRPAVTQPVQPTPTANISLDEAKAAALKDAGLKLADVTFTKAILDTDNLVNEYELEFYTKTAEYDYDINAKTGAIIDKSVEAIRPAVTQPVQPTPTANISLDEAKAAALKDAGLKLADVTFTKAILDTDNLVDEYELEFYTKTTEYDYDINAKTGAIIDKSVETIRPAVTQPVQPTPTANISLDEAKAAALKDAGLKLADVTFTKAILDRDDGTEKYDIEFYYGTVEYEYEINAKTGAIIEKAVENHAPTPSTGTTYIGIDKAKSAAVSHAGLNANDVRFTKAKLEDDDGRSVYEIEFRYGVYEYEYEIDALNGTIIEFDKDIDN